MKDFNFAKDKGLTLDNIEFKKYKCAKSVNFFPGSLYTWHQKKEGKATFRQVMEDYINKPDPFPPLIL